MTRKELNKFIEAQKIAARDKVRADCYKMLESRKLEIANSVNLPESLELAVQHMKVAVDSLEACIFKIPKLISDNDYSSTIYRLHGALNEANLHNFMKQAIEMRCDGEYKKIIEFEKESIKEINVNYDVVRDNCMIHTNIKDAITYLESLGFVIPTDEKPSAQLMKPLDPRFLISKGEPVKGDI